VSRYGTFKVLQDSLDCIDQCCGLGRSFPVMQQIVVANFDGPASIWKRPRSKKLRCWKSQLAKVALERSRFFRTLSGILEFRSNGLPRNSFDRNAIETRSSMFTPSVSFEKIRSSGDGA
jgi:hypothetical protein